MDYISGGFGIIPNELLDNSNISLKAKGLYAYIQSKPHDWMFSLEKIAHQNKDGIDSVRNGIIELCEAGFLTKKRINNKNNLVFYEYKLETEIEKAKMGLSNVGSPDLIAKMGKSNVGKSNVGYLKTEFTPIVIKKDNSIIEYMEKKEQRFDDRFEKFWGIYGKEIQKEKCYENWKYINTIDKDKILKALPKYIASTPELQYRKNPLNYLMNKVWKDEVIFYKERELDAKAEKRAASAVIIVPDNY